MDIRLYRGPSLSADQVDVNFDRVPVRDSSETGNARHRWITPDTLRKTLEISLNTGLSLHLADFNNPHRDTIENITNTGVTYNSGVIQTNSFSGSAFKINSGNFVLSTGNYTLRNTDNGKFVLMSGAGPVSVFVPTGLSQGFSCLVSSEGTGVVSFTGAGTALQTFSGYSLYGQYTSATVWQKTPNIYRIDGFLT